MENNRLISKHNGGVVLGASAIVLDVNDIEKEANFWSGMLGEEPGLLRGDGGWLTVGELNPSTWLVLQRVPETKVVKNRCHIDSRVADVNEALLQIVALGGSQVSDFREGGGVTCTDPEGNEFCIGAFSRDKAGNRVY